MKEFFLNAKHSESNLFIDAEHGTGKFKNYTNGVINPRTKNNLIGN